MVIVCLQLNWALGWRTQNLLMQALLKPDSPITLRAALGLSTMILGVFASAKLALFAGTLRAGPLGYTAITLGAVLSSTMGFSALVWLNSASKHIAYRLTLALCAAFAVFAWSVASDPSGWLRRFTIIVVVSAGIAAIVSKTRPLVSAAALVALTFVAVYAVVVAIVLVTKSAADLTLLRVQASVIWPVSVIAGATLAAGWQMRRIGVRRRAA
jgi:hypothetical protein